MIVTRSTRMGIFRGFIAAVCLWILCAPGCAPKVRCYFTASPALTTEIIEPTDHGIFVGEVDPNEAIGHAVTDVLRDRGVDLAVTVQLDQLGGRVAVADFTPHGATITFDENLLRAWLGNVSAEPFWGIRTIIAHEVGHILNGHTISGSPGRLRELAADRFAGEVMYRLGASLDQVSRAFYFIADEKAKGPYPARARRLAEVRAGWRIARDRDTRALRLLDYGDAMNRACAAWREGDSLGTEQLLLTLLPPAGQDDLRGPEWFHLWSLSHADGARQSLLTADPSLYQEPEVRAATFREDSTLLGVARLLVRPHHADRAVVAHTAFYMAERGQLTSSPVAIVTEDFDACTWDAARGHFLCGKRATEDIMVLARFSPDGNEVGRDHVLLPLFGTIQALSVSGDGTKCAVASDDVVAIVDLNAGIATVVNLWDGPGTLPDCLLALDHRGTRLYAAMEDDGDTSLAMVELSDSPFRVWYCPDAQLSQIRDLAASADGELVALASKSGAGLWKVVPSRGEFRWVEAGIASRASGMAYMAGPPQLSEDASSVQFAAGGERLVVAGLSNVGVFSLSRDNFTMTLASRVTGFPQEPIYAQLTRDGALLLAGVDGAVSRSFPPLGARRHVPPDGQSAVLADERGRCVYIHTDNTGRLRPSIEPRPRSGASDYGWFSRMPDFDVRSLADKARYVIGVDSRLSGSGHLSIAVANTSDGAYVGTTQIPVKGGAGTVVCCGAADVPRLVVATGDQVGVWGWSADSPKGLCAIWTSVPPGEGARYLPVVAIDPSGRIAAYVEGEDAYQSDNSSRIIIEEYATGSQIVGPVETTSIVAARFDASGNKVAYVVANGDVVVLDRLGRVPVLRRRLNRRAHEAVAIAFDDRSLRLYVQANPGSPLEVWDLTLGVNLARLPGTSDGRDAGIVLSRPGEDLCITRDIVAAWLTEWECADPEGVITLLCERAESLPNDSMSQEYVLRSLWGAYTKAKRDGQSDALAPIVSRLEAIIRGALSADQSNPSLKTWADVIEDARQSL